jgi:hypothetical protein
LRGIFRSPPFGRIAEDATHPSTRSFSGLSLALSPPPLLPERCPLGAMPSAVYVGAFAVSRQSPQRDYLSATALQSSVGTGSLALRSCRHCRSSTNVYSVFVCSALPRVLLLLLRYVCACRRMGAGLKPQTTPLRLALSLWSFACVLRYARPQPRAHGAPSSGARSLRSRAPLLGRAFATRAQLRACRRAPFTPFRATRATSGTLNYFRDVRGLHDEPLRYDVPHPTTANIVSSRTFPSHRMTYGKLSYRGLCPQTPSVLIRGIDY